MLIVCEWRCGRRMMESPVLGRWCLAFLLTAYLVFSDVAALNSVPADIGVCRETREVEVMHNTTVWRPCIVSGIIYRQRNCPHTSSRLQVTNVTREVCCEGWVEGPFGYCIRKRYIGAAAEVDNATISTGTPSTTTTILLPRGEEAVRTKPHTTATTTYVHTPSTTTAPPGFVKWDDDHQLGAPPYNSTSHIQEKQQENQEEENPPPVPVLPHLTHTTDSAFTLAVTPHNVTAPMPTGAATVWGDPEPDGLASSSSELGVGVEGGGHQTRTSPDPGGGGAEGGGTVVPTSGEGVQMPPIDWAGRDGGSWVGIPSSTVRDVAKNHTTNTELLTRPITNTSITTTTIITNHTTHNTITTTASRGAIVGNINASISSDQTVSPSYPMLNITDVIDLLHRTTGPGSVIIAATSSPTTILTVYPTRIRPPSAGNTTPRKPPAVNSTYNVLEVPMRVNPLADGGKASGSGGAPPNGSLVVLQSPGPQTPLLPPAVYIAVTIAAVVIVVTLVCALYVFILRDKPRTPARHRGLEVGDFFLTESQYATVGGNHVNGDPRRNATPNGCLRALPMPDVPLTVDGSFRPMHVLAGSPLPNGVSQLRMVTSEEPPLTTSTPVISHDKPAPRFGYTNPAYSGSTGDTRSLSDADDDSLPVAPDMCNTDDCMNGGYLIPVSQRLTPPPTPRPPGRHASLRSVHEENVENELRRSASLLQNGIGDMAGIHHPLSVSRTGSNDTHTYEEIPAHLTGSNSLLIMPSDIRMSKTNSSDDDNDSDEVVIEDDDTSVDLVTFMTEYISKSCSITDASITPCGNKPKYAHTADPNATYDRADFYTPATPSSADSSTNAEGVTPPSEISGNREASPGRSSVSSVYAASTKVRLREGGGEVGHWRGDARRCSSYENIYDTVEPVVTEEEVRDDTEGGVWETNDKDCKEKDVEERQAEEEVAREGPPDEAIRSTPCGGNTPCLPTPVPPARRRLFMSPAQNSSVLLPKSHNFDYDVIDLSDDDEVVTHWTPIAGGADNSGAKTLVTNGDGGGVAPPGDVEPHYLSLLGDDEASTLNEHQRVDPDAYCVGHWEETEA